MTDVTARLLDLRVAALRFVSRRRGERLTPIVPPRNVAGRAMTTVIAIMTFLASLTVGAVTLVSDSAGRWENDISGEITVQVKPTEGLDMDAALERVRAIALQSAGVTNASILDDAATGRLLEPWLGSGVDLDELPVPRLVVIGIDTNHPPNFSALSQTIAAAVPEAELDDHRAWVSRLVVMARAMVIAGVSILTLVLVATILTVIFATRGAMSGNRHIIEVLHFVGARSQFIAAEFQRHFFRLGLFGAIVGGSLAMMLFYGLGLWTESNRATPEADQFTALFGSFSIGWPGYVGVIALIATVAGLTALTSRLTVTKQLEAIDMISPVEG
ncbi:ABC transporter permease [Aurantimonas sp. VKM B-3413]|uniref:cell division protein FtsX n=1 Tax=Aurantimonas sp. VKM B-3413 TaxID=2779401 RepID=UPI001E587962|nr:ABC transporter permease [Aurantimonas sp. VKM B-3413]MCB8837236.1 ABC transporter permease [Aurantimonas sp. VKM B-3413]